MPRPGQSNSYIEWGQRPTAVACKGPPGHRRGHVISAAGALPSTSSWCCTHPIFMCRRSKTRTTGPEACMRELCC